MKILVIGGSRFVGPLLTDRLTQHGHEVTIFNRGHKYGQNLNKNFKQIIGDRNGGFSAVTNKFDAVIDTCAYNGRQAETAVKELKFDFYVNFGSVASYKKSEIFPITEEFPLGPWSPFGDYGQGKMEVEEVLKKSGCDYASVRPVYILGPRNYVERERFIYHKIISGEPIIVPGNGQAVVQFVFAKKVANTIALLAEKKIPGAFNCAGDDLITLDGLVLEMAKIAGRKAIIEHNPKTDGKNYDENQFPFANENLIFSNQKLKSLGLAFEPLLKGLKRDYEEYYKDHLRLS
ncbi:MAG: NAD-dependent epimerase/dehydratase family protein [Patescibacteria group bacterium]|nr:NAD-dependent epimerase/dehydratase family protein [Patescibacteria group bacterium]